jgi:hypothetical protein
MYYSRDQNKKDEIWEAGGMEWGTGEVHRGFWWENPIKIYYLEDLGVDCRRILK